MLFAATSKGEEAPIYWYWDFGDAINSKDAMNAIHTFTKPGDYTVGLTVEMLQGAVQR
ncbi:cell surface protein [Methanosarcina siciliae C2J]|uniref:Cell surface protein n=1 Tax=Methanosarcina siciliae C2J TaxID=1434118 RepID=A0A0E3PQ55_9EURY|nr:PKD domain-containing protein [Methanosarcina siciliae]AKB36715.1 cell surface protein [Methanosarcina siciliae C2J]